MIVGKGCLYDSLFTAAQVINPHRPVSPARPVGKNQAKITVVPEYALDLLLYRQLLSLFGRIFPGKSVDPAVGKRQHRLITGINQFCMIVSG